MSKPKQAYLLMSPLVISCSHNPRSRSAAMARHALECLAEAHAKPTLLDLAQVELPFCDGGASYGHENVPGVQSTIKEASGILLATPVYNYDANAAAKNLLELTGKAWTGKVVGLLCAAGGQSSYMSLMPFANSLMLDFRCVIIPRFVYATGQSFTDGQVVDEGVQQRIARLSLDLLGFSNALDGLTENAEDN